MATPKTLTTFEAQRLLMYLEKSYDTKPQEHKCTRNHTIALLMLDAGLRVGEVVQLRIADLYFNSLPVTSIIIRPEIAKNKTERIIPVSQRLSEALKKMHECFWTDYPMIPDDWVFIVSNNSYPLTTRQVERIIRAAAMKALGRPVHPHVLRHTFASNLMRVTDMRTVQELLGHKQMSSTQIYTHPNSEDKVKAIACLDPGCINTTADLEALRRAANAPNRPDTSRTDRDMG